MKHKVRRIVSLASVLTLGACALGMFAGCTTKHPEVTITYSFNGKDYSVTYTLSRNDAPKTVQHFIELADAGYYDGMCVHDYTSNALYTGGYKLEEDDSGDGKLVEVNYFETVKKLESEKGIKFTQSVWKEKNKTEPLYTVYGEFYDNGVQNAGARDNRHSAGALVMYYTDKGAFNDDVAVERADGGKNNDGEAIQYRPYSKNSATSLFYTYTGYSNSALDNSYCVFGMAKEDDYEDEFENGLLAAIKEYEDSLADDVSFTEENKVRLNQYEPFDNLRTADIDATFRTPVDKPITIKSVKVTKY